MEGSNGRRNEFLIQKQHLEACWMASRLKGGYMQMVLQVIARNEEHLRYKARFVVKGFTQEEGMYYHEVFLLIVTQTSINVSLTMLAHKDL